MTKNPDTHLNELGFSPDALAQRKAELLKLLEQAAPEVISDKQVNLDKLKDLLGEDRIAPPEHYELSWAGKTAARREIQKSTSHTLRPSAGNPEKAQHMLIEGENLEVLRVLQKSYFGKVKMIYIDPPYNTGNDSFVYPDAYAETLEEYQRRTGEKNAAGFLNKQNLWKKNSKESGQYHSAWLSMMYPRLYLARNLLRDDGVIFISIDDNEAANLKVLCDEVFGIENFVAQVSRATGTPTGGGGLSAVVNELDYILIYSKFPKIKFVGSELTEEESSIYDRSDEKGRYLIRPLRRTGGEDRREDRPTMFYPLTAPDGKEVYPIAPAGYDSRWICGIDKYKDLLNNGLIEWRLNGENWVVYQKFYLEGRLKQPGNLWTDVEGNKKATREIKSIFDGQKIFTFPKPVDLIKKVLQISTDSESIVIDFFAGSGTTAHSVMELNLEDGGNRQCISIQMPEVLDEDSEAYKAGYRTIADITRARIEKVIAKLKSEHPDKTADLACAHFTLAPSNFKVWRGDVSSEAALREQLALFQSAEKPAQSAQDEATEAQTAMLAELLLKHGLGALGVHAISEPRQMAGVTVHRVLMHDNKRMWLCFEHYTEALKDEIVKGHPAHVVLLNSCFVGDKADEQLANLQLELVGHGIGLTII